MPQEECAERARLSKPVVDAVAEVHHLKEALMKARRAERAARRALADHVAAHCCQR
jgi:hypothetical protein